MFKVCPWDKVGLFQEQIRFVAGTILGSSQGQPNQKVYVYVPLFGIFQKVFSPKGVPRIFDAFLTQF